ncbi:tyrosine-type recombinase/integrase [Frankia gtarii]|uniref:tyrosine-type recombinase/integrase n=1 Tax=Frankia gtarii TaxID=2950102 RepID=UPI0021C04B81|nr:hypothetical protein [Frankia gtarii]
MASYETLPARADGKVRIRAYVQNLHHQAPTAIDPKTGEKKTVWREIFDTKAAARKWTEKIERKLDAGIDPDAVEVRPEAETLTVGDWRARWWPTYCRATRKAPRSVEETDRRWRLHVEPRWGDTTFAALDRLEIQDWVDEELSGWAAPGTVGLIYKDLHLLCTAAVDHRPPILLYHPCYKIRMPDPTRPEAIYTDAAGIARIAERCGFYADLVWSKWGTGWRWAELVGLRRDLKVTGNPRAIDNGPCVDVDAGVLRIHPAQGCLIESKGGLTAGPPKTKGSARTTPVPQFVMDMIEARLKMSEGPYVWYGPRGGLLRRSTFGRRVWRPACDGRPGYPKRHGTPSRSEWAPLAAGMKVHGIRHSHKAALEAGGIPDPAIEARLGHGRNGISGLYSHVLSEVETLIVKDLQARYEAAIAS